MAYTYATLTTAIRDYTEVDDSVFTQAIIDDFIMSAEHRINIELPMDSDRFVDEGTMAANVNNIRVPGGALFIRGVEVFNVANSTEAYSNQKQIYTNFKCIVVTRDSVKIGFDLIHEQPVIINEQPDCLRTLKLCFTPLNEVILNIFLHELSS